MFKGWSDILKRLLLILPIPVIWLALWHFGFLNFLENKAMDWRFRMRGEIDSPVKLIYVDLDAETNRQFGEKPWPRANYGRIADYLFYFGNVKAIGFDLVMSQYVGSTLVPKELIDHDVQQFSEVTNFYRNIILATAYTGEKGKQLPLIYVKKDQYDIKTNDHPETPHPKFAGIDKMGLINTDEQLSGGVVPRWVPLFAEAYIDAGPFSKTLTYYQIALQLARVSHGLLPESIKRYDDRIELVNEEGAVLFNIPLWQKQMMEVNYFSKFYSPKSPHYSMITVADAFDMLKGIKPNGEPEEDESKADKMKAEAERFFSDFNDAIVMIGPTDPLLQDIAPSPFDDNPVPKVGVHGNVLKTIFSGLYIKRLPKEVKIGLTFLLTLLVAMMATATGKSGGLGKLGGGFILIGYTFLVFWEFKEYHRVIPLITPIGSAVSASLIGAMVQLLIEEKQKGRIKGMFGAYLSPDLVNSMVESGEEPQLGGITAEISAYFSDVQSFSAFSEKLTPEQLVDLMNEYLTAMTNILMAEGCYVDKYIGDAIVGIFNAPVALEDHAMRACVSSQLMQKRQAELRDKWKSEGDKWPPIVSQMQTRMGANTGPATVGNMGSETRLNYTMMGDTVNLAARCESGAKAYGVYTMVTGETKCEAEKFGNDCVFRYLDKIIVKGRTQPAVMYEIMGLRKDLTDEAFECLGIYDEATKNFLAQNWDKAIELYEKAAQLEPNRPELNPYAPTTPSVVLIERARSMKETPPGDDWDGVYVMTSK